MKINTSLTCQNSISCRYVFNRVPHSEIQWFGTPTWPPSSMSEKRNGGKEARPATLAKEATTRRVCNISGVCAHCRETAAHVCLLDYIAFCILLRSAVALPFPAFDSKAGHICQSLLLRHLSCFSSARATSLPVSRPSHVCQRCSDRFHEAEHPDRRLGLRVCSCLQKRTRPSNSILPPWAPLPLRSS